jgi:hypothetical protein
MRACSCAIMHIRRTVDAKKTYPSTASTICKPDVPRPTASWRGVLPLLQKQIHTFLIKLNK